MTLWLRCPCGRAIEIEPANNGITETTCPICGQTFKIRMMIELYNPRFNP